MERKIKNATLQLSTQHLIKSFVQENMTPITWKFPHFTTQNSIFSLKSLSISENQGERGWALLLSLHTFLPRPLLIYFEFTGN